MNKTLLYLFALVVLLLAWIGLRRGPPSATLPEAATEEVAKSGDAAARQMPAALQGAEPVPGDRESVDGEPPTSRTDRGNAKKPAYGIRARVLDGSQTAALAPVHSVRVLASLSPAVPDLVPEKPREWQAVSDGNGWATLVLPGPDTYFLRVDPASVPPGLSALGNFNTAGHFPGISAQEVTIKAAGQEPEVELVLLAARSITGQVQGDFPPKCEVRADSTTPGQEGVSFSTPIDPSGRFAFENLLPLIYVLRVECRAPQPGCPPPLFADVRSDSAFGIILPVGAGPGSIVGSVVNEQGLGVEGVDVIAFYRPQKDQPRWGAPADYRFTWNDRAGSGITVADGTFRIEGAHHGPITVLVGPRASSNFPGTGPRIVSCPPPADILLSESSGNLVTLAPITVTMRP